MTDMLEIMGFAAEAHRNQKYGKEDYIWHCFRVARNFDSWTFQAVALLHDVLEDTNKTEEDIVELCGQFIADSVKILTHQSNEIYMDYILRVRSSKITRLVKIADLNDNLFHAMRDPNYASLIPRYKKALEILNEVS